MLDQVPDVFGPTWDAAKDSTKKAIAACRVAGQVISWLMYLLARPFVLVTQVLFRKEMGERYIDGNCVVLSLLLIIFSWYVNDWTAGPRTITETTQTYYAVQTRTIPNPQFETVATASTWLGALWLLAFLTATLWHFHMTVRRRRRDGALWHSRCSGVPRLPGLTFAVEMILLLALTVLAFWFGLIGFGILLAMSLITSFQSEMYARQVLYNRVLDAVDAQIESELLGKAIEKRLAPAKVQGLEASLPAYVSNEYRRKIAGMLKTGQVSDAAAELVGAGAGDSK